MVLAHSDIQSGMNPGSALADYDVSGDDPLAAAFFDAKPSSG